MRKIFLLCVLSFALLTNLNADVSVKQEGDFITLKNSLISVSIDLSRGARVGSYIYKGFNDEELIFDYKSGNGGLFKDLWTIQGWPGEFNKRLYKSKILKKGPSEAVVKTWTMSTGKNRNQVQIDLTGILIEKTFILKKGERILTVEMAFTNKGQTGKRPAYWSQSAVDFDKQRKNNIYWRPTRHGVDWIDNEHQTSENGNWYIAKSIAGWNGVTNRKMKRGLVFLMDYNDLRQLYDNTAANTMEWMYDAVAIPAGKTWRTKMQLIPTEGFSGYVFADSELVADFSVVKTPAGLAITHTLSAATLPLKNIKIQTEVIGAKNKWSAKGAPITKDSLGFAPLIKTINVSGVGAMPCIVKVDVTAIKSDGKKLKIHYENYFGGTAGRNLDLVTLEPMYEFKIPEKKKQYLKPDKIKLIKNKVPKILFVRGLWAEFNGIDDAIKQLGDVKVVDGWMKKSALGETLGNFPASYEDLLSYDVIILGNVSGPMLSSVGQEMLADFVKAGGGVLMLGGDRTYGQASFSNPNFTILLPVNCKKRGDYGKLKKASKLKIVKNNSITKGISFDGSETVLYTHFLKPSGNAETVIELGDGTPALIVNKNNKNKIAAVTILPFGEASKGKKLYGENKNWAKLMANTIKWLMGK